MEQTYVVKNLGGSGVALGQLLPPLGQFLIKTRANTFTAIQVTDDPGEVGNFIHFHFGIGELIRLVDTPLGPTCQIVWATGETVILRMGLDPFGGGDFLINGAEVALLELLQSCCGGGEPPPPFEQVVARSYPLATVDKTADGPGGATAEWALPAQTVDGAWVVTVPWFANVLTKNGTASSWFATGDTPYILITSVNGVEDQQAIEDLQDPAFPAFFEQVVDQLVLAGQPGYPPLGAVTARGELTIQFPVSAGVSPSVKVALLTNTGLDAGGNLIRFRLVCEPGRALWMPATAEAEIPNV